jgi:hypothetical protein
VFVTSIYYGWNGSGGILFAIGWEFMRGRKMGVLVYGFGAAVLGSIFMEGNFTSTKIY